MKYTFLANGKWLTFESTKELCHLEERVAQIQIEGCVNYIPAIGRMNDESTPYIQAIPEKYRKIYPCNTCWHAMKIADGWGICNKPTPSPYGKEDGYMHEYPLRYLREVKEE